MSLSVVRTADAARELRDLGSQRRGRLAIRLRQFAASGLGAGLVHVRTTTDLAAGEVLRRREVLVVYAIRSLREVEEMIVGPELMRTFVLREVARTVHR